MLAILMTGLLISCKDEGLTSTTQPEVASVEAPMGLAVLGAEQQREMEVSAARQFAALRGVSSETTCIFQAAYLGPATYIRDFNSLFLLVEQTNGTLNVAPRGAEYLFFVWNPAVVREGDLFPGNLGAYICTD
jgi:hypothetical protein